LKIAVCGIGVAGSYLLSRLSSTALEILVNSPNELIAPRVSDIAYNAYLATCIFERFDKEASDNKSWNEGKKTRAYNFLANYAANLQLFFAHVNLHTETPKWEDIALNYRLNC